jgi:hypothetical protein
LLIFGRDKLDCKSIYPSSSKIVSGGFKFLDVFSINFKIDPKITQVSEIALLGDRIQLDHCKRAKRYEKDDPRREFHLNRRDLVADALNGLQVALIAKNADPKGMKKSVEKSLENLQNILRCTSLEKNIDQISKEYPVKDPTLTMLGG